MTLTLQTIQDHQPCQDDWTKLLQSVGGDMTTELSIGDVLISNGLNDALWCLQFLEPRQRVAAIMPAVKRASVHTTDQRVHGCITAIEKWLAGDDSVNLDLAALEATLAAREAAEAAALAAAEAAWASLSAAKAAACATCATWAAGSARAAERKLQHGDLLSMFPPMILKGE